MIVLFEYTELENNALNDRVLPGCNGGVMNKIAAL